MATVQTPGERYVEFDEYVEYQLDRARNGIKWTDILAAAAGVASLVVGYLVLFVIADHWLFERGVPQAVRYSAFGIISVISLLWLGVKVVRPYLKKVNDLYAARMLENAEPSLKGSLFGLVDSRRSGRKPVEEVHRALEKRAATTLSSIDVDTSLDRKPLMRMSYLLLVLVLIACAYAILSPKRIGPSLLRALTPSSSIGVATRTEILDVRPGDANVLAGAQLEIEVLIRGEAPDKVFLYYSTADRRFVDEPIEMRLSDETTRAYRAALIGDSGKGLTQDVTYRIEANDDASGPFQVTVNQPPAATVQTLSLEFPSYTQREGVVQDVPSIEAIEGTKVNLTAEANRPLKSAKLVFADDEQFLTRGEEVPLRIDTSGRALTASWTLTVRSDGTSPKFYRIDCRDVEGKMNPSPVVYPISIRPDQPPEIALLDPKSDSERPANAVIPLVVNARDPDFQLREVILRLERKGQELPERTVLWEGSESEVAIRFDWDLAPLGLQPGDVLTFYAQARDNREPESNRRNTPKLNIVIREPVAEAEVQKQLDEEHQRQNDELSVSDDEDVADERGEQPNTGDSDEIAPRDSEASRDRSDDDRAEDEDTESEEEGSQSRNQRPKESRKPLKNDGSQDDEVLRRLIERQREKQREETQKDQTEQNQPQSDQEKDQTDSEESGDGVQGSEGEGRAEGQKEEGNSGERQQKEQDSKSMESGTGSDNSERSENEASENAGDANEQSPEQGSQENEGESNQRSDEQTGASGNSTTPSKGDSGEKSSAGNGSESSGNDANEVAGDDEANPSTSSGTKPGEAANKPGTGSTESESAESNKSGSSNADADGEGAVDEGAAKQDQKSNDSTEKASDNQRGESADGVGESKSTDEDAGGSETMGDNLADEGMPNALPSKGDSNPENETSDRQSEQSESENSGSGAADAQKRDQPGSSTDEKSASPRSDQDLKEGAERDPTSSSSGKSDAETGQEPKSPKDATPAESGEDGSRQPQADGNTTGESKSSNASEDSSRSSNTGSSETSRGEPSESERPDPGSHGEASEDSPEASSGEEGTGEKGEAGKEGADSPSASSKEKGSGGEGENSEKSSQPSDGKSAENRPDTSSSETAGQKGAENEDSGTGKAQKESGGQTAESQGEGSKAGESTSDAPSGSSPSSSQPGTKPGNGSSSPTGSAKEVGSGESSGNTATPEQANQDFAEQATDLALRNLENELRRGDIDPKLLEELGWTEQDMERFADRLRRNLSAPTDEETPDDVARRMEFQHMLENLSFGESSGPRKARSDRSRDVGDVGTVNPQVPSEYRDAFEAFTRSVAGQRNSSERSK